MFDILTSQFSHKDVSHVDVSQVPADHPPIDWTNWEPAGPEDSRSPCPILNALANHHILPHSGRHITKEAAITALTTSLNLDTTTASIFTNGALQCNPDPSAASTTSGGWFDLEMITKHGIIEHDVSMSRADVALGDSKNFNRELWDEYIKNYDGMECTDLPTASKARAERFMKCREMHERAGKRMQFGLKEATISYGETALFTGVLGDDNAGTCPVKYLRVMFEEERMPYAEGWRTREKTFGQKEILSLITRLIAENPHRSVEAKEVGVDTMHAVQDGIKSALSSICTIM